MRQDWPALPTAAQDLAPHLRLLLDVLDEPALLVQADGTLLAANAAFGRDLNMPWRDICGRHLASLLATEWEKAAVFLRRAAASRNATTGALLFRQQSGAISCRCQGNLVQVGSHAAPAIISLRCHPRAGLASPFSRLNHRLDELTREVARRTVAEERLRQLNRDLETRVAQAVAAREQARARLAQAQRMEALGQLAAGIAHDGNNILQAISGGLAVISSRAGEVETVKRFAAIAQDAATRGAAIASRLLAFSRRGELRAAPLDLVRLLAGLEDLLGAALESSIVLHRQIAAGTPMVMADKGQLETVLVNLIINARDAMPDGGTVSITAAADSGPADLPGAFVRLAITDTGMGMDEATLARASEPFFTTKPLGKGTGLGLAMARDFAQQSGGDLAVASASGQGTVVTIWLPQAQTDGSTDATSAEQQAALPTQGVRILFVDDDALVREVLSEALGYQGFHVAQAADGAAAIAWLRNGQDVDLLITDFSMPGMNGLQLIAAARDLRPMLPALLLTGYADEDLKSGVARVGDAATALLRKPIGYEDLAARALSLLEQARAGA